MIEVALVFGPKGKTMYWHDTPDASTSYIPDSRELWNFIWQNKDDITGIAHTHPHRGTPFPSHEDITTFEAMEQGIGKSFLWPIVSIDKGIIVGRINGSGWHQQTMSGDYLQDVNELRQRSGF